MLKFKSSAICNFGKLSTRYFRKHAVRQWQPCRCSTIERLKTSASICKTKALYGIAHPGPPDGLRTLLLSGAAVAPGVNVPTGLANLWKSWPEIVFCLATACCFPQILSTCEARGLKGFVWQQPAAIATLLTHTDSSTLLFGCRCVAWVVLVK